MQTQVAPVLLFNGECAVCRTIAHWVGVSAQSKSGAVRLTERPIGDDPAALRLLNPNLDIWDAYETIHLVMPDGSMKVGGGAVAEVLRRLPNCKWFAWTFGVNIFGLRPFQLILDLGYVILADARPLLGCESCGIPSPPVKFIKSMIDRVRGAHPTKKAAPHFTRSIRS
jgi:predicted DCC family thiol-disulfide oxidoreductase YuxK